MFLSNPADGPMLTLKVPGVVPFPIELKAGECVELDDKHMGSIQPFVKAFSLSITKGKPKAATVAPLNEPAPTAEQQAPLNEPAPKVTKEKPLNEPAPKTTRAKIAK